MAGTSPGPASITVHYDAFASSSALTIFFAVIGGLKMWTLRASATALEMAGAATVMAGSPMPLAPKASGRSSIQG